MRTYPLFSAIGVEWEYMIVDSNTLDIRPITDQLFLKVNGSYEGSVDRGPIEWSNELALHVVELKTNGPAASLAGLPELIHSEVSWINEQLQSLGAVLAPTAMHPWMNPATETKLWPHDYNPVYEAFNRVFNCQGHGWSNLQSLHVNFPFANDDEFGRLHAAIRLALPLLPALAASSPFQDGRATGFIDSRINTYRFNCAKIPSISGSIIPEQVFSIDQYQNELLPRLYRDIAPHDPEGELQEEWVNARGAIARFDRNTIEIRLLDIQECPAADAAIAEFIQRLLKALVEERWVSYREQQSHTAESLLDILLAVVQDGSAARISDAEYLSALGFANSTAMAAGEILKSLAARIWPANSPASVDRSPLELILRNGCLSERLLRTTAPNPNHDTLVSVYTELCHCLRDNRMHIPRTRASLSRASIACP